MGQEAAERWTAQADSQPGRPKSDRLLGAALPVVMFDARQASQALMLLDVLVSQIETDGLLGR